MLIQRLKVAGLLSFGPGGIDLPMEPLSVLIGPNGAGKSNLLEVFALLRAAPRDLAEPVKLRGGVWEWLWKGEHSPRVATVEAIVDCCDGEGPVKYALAFGDDGGRLHVTGEEITRLGGHGPDAEAYFRLDSELQVVDGGGRGRTSPTALRTVKSQESILSQLRDPLDYPTLYRLQERYEGIRLYRNWSFGPFAAFRRDRSAHATSGFLNDGAENLAVVLSHFRGQEKRELVAALRELFDGVVDVSCPVAGGAVSLFLEEHGGREIPATLLSDGTLRYMSLLAILLHPSPPPFIALEAPELGLHPDVVAEVAKLLVQASERTQIVVTTHSRILIDALTDHPFERRRLREGGGRRITIRAAGRDETERVAGQIQSGRALELRRIGGQSLVSVVIYIEGGGDHDQNLARLFRRAWRKFFLAAGLKGRMPRVVKGGGRERTFGLFRTEVERPKPGYLPLLLVDSEEKVASGQSPWQHLRERDKWERPRDAGDGQAYMMVQAMETWLVADRTTLGSHFGGAFRENVLPRWPNLEDVSKEDSSTRSAGRPPSVRDPTPRARSRSNCWKRPTPPASRPSARMPRCFWTFCDRCEPHLRPFETGPRVVAGASTS